MRLRHGAVACAAVAGVAFVAAVGIAHRGPDAPQVAAQASALALSNAMPDGAGTGALPMPRPDTGRARVHMPSAADAWRELSQTPDRHLRLAAAMRWLEGPQAHVAQRALEVELAAPTTPAQQAYSIAELLAMSGRDMAYLQWLVDTLARSPEVLASDTPEFPAAKAALLSVASAAGTADVGTALQLLAAALEQHPEDADLRQLQTDLRAVQMARHNAPRQP